MFLKLTLLTLLCLKINLANCVDPEERPLGKKVSKSGDEPIENLSDLESSSIESPQNLKLIRISRQELGEKWSIGIKVDAEFTAKQASDYKKIVKRDRRSNNLGRGRRRRSLSFSLSKLFSVNIGHHHDPPHYRHSHYGNSFESDYYGPYSYGRGQRTPTKGQGWSSGPVYSEEWSPGWGWPAPAPTTPATTTTTTVATTTRRPMRLLTETQAEFFEVNLNHTRALEYQDEVQKADPALGEKLVARLNGVTCQDLCEPNVVSEGLLGICTADYCQCGFHSWQLSHKRCEKEDYVYDPVEKKCDLPQNTIMCSDDPEVTTTTTTTASPVPLEPTHLLVPIVRVQQHQPILIQQQHQPQVIVQKQPQILIQQHHQPQVLVQQHEPQQVLLQHQPQQLLVQQHEPQQVLVQQQQSHVLLQQPQQQSHVLVQQPQQQSHVLVQQPQQQYVIQQQPQQHYVIQQEHPQVLVQHQHQPRIIVQKHEHQHQTLLVEQQQPQVVFSG